MLVEHVLAVTVNFAHLTPSRLYDLHLLRAFFPSLSRLWFSCWIRYTYDTLHQQNEARNTLFDLEREELKHCRETGLMSASGNARRQQHSILIEASHLAMKMVQS